MTENPLGRIELHDPKSRNYEFAVRKDSRPISVRHAMNAPHVDQFYLSACVGFSGTNMLNCAAALRSRRKFNFIFNSSLRSLRGYLDNEDGITNYSNATVFDPFDWEYPPTDEGSSALGLMKFWNKQGIISGYDWCFTFDQFLAALQRQPVLVGTEWFENMMTPDRLGRVQPTGESVGGHEYLATQIIWKTRHIGFEQSWGESWGMGGRFYMSFDAVEYLLTDNGDAAVPRFL